MGVREIIQNRSYYVVTTYARQSFVSAKTGVFPSGFSEAWQGLKTLHHPGRYRSIQKVRGNTFEMAQLQNMDSVNC